MYWEENKPLRVIAENYDVSIPCIRGWMKQMNIPRRTNSEAQILSQGTETLTKEHLMKLYAEGLSQSEIAQRYKISQSSIKHKMKVWKIPTRGKSNPGAKNGMHGRTHTQESRAKIREANRRQFSNPANRERHAELTCQQIKDGRTGKAYNKLEALVAKMLTAQGIQFEQQFRLGRFLFDFYVPASNTLIEVHGTFWHADPRVYGDKPLTPIQERNLANDKRKAERAERDGYKLMVLWEYDVLAMLSTMV